MDIFPELGSAPLESNAMPSFAYDECLSFKSPEYEEFSQISGQYCWMGSPRFLPNYEQYKKNPIPDWALKLWAETALSSFNKNSSEKKSSRDNSIKASNLPRFAMEIMFTFDYIDPINARISSGICLPKSCKPQDIENAINKCM